MPSLCHPGHTKILVRAATSQLNERSFIVAFGIDLSVFAFSIEKAIWAVSTCVMTALAFVALEPFFVSPCSLCGIYFPEGCSLILV